MSTKIYDAFKVKTSLSEVQRYLFILRTEYFDYCKFQLNRMYSNKERPDFYKLKEQIEKAIDSGLWDPFNIEASVVMYVDGNNFFVQFIGIPSDLLTKWSKRPTFKKHFTDYHYQNQSDREPGITDKDWDEREEVWDRVFADRRYTPAMAGWTMQFIDSGNVTTFLRHAFKEEVDKQV